MQTPDDVIASQLLTFSLQALEQVQAIVAEHDEAPHLRFGQRALADEMTALVHGAPAAVAAAEALLQGTRWLPSPLRARGPATA